MDVPPIGDSRLGVVDVARPHHEHPDHDEGRPYTSAQFALDMVEGVQKVRFTTKGG